MPATAEERAFWAAILTAPAADLPRLVYADYLEENGRAERAEFIRLQCENATGTTKNPGGDMDTRLRAVALLNQFGDTWIGGEKVHHRWRGFHADNDVSSDPHRRTDVTLTWHRGFVVRVTCPVAWFAGTRCGCENGSQDTGGTTPWGEPISEKCPHCDGRGYVNANGPKLLLGRHPLADVEITDRRPFADRWWYDEAEATGIGRDDDPASDLPTWVFGRLRQPLDGKERPDDEPRSRRARPYSSHTGACPQEDLTHALLSLPPEDL